MAKRKELVDTRKNRPHPQVVVGKIRGNEIAGRLAKGFPGQLWTAHKPLAPSRPKMNLTRSRSAVSLSFFSVPGNINGPTTARQARGQWQAIPVGIPDLSMTWTLPEREPICRDAFSAVKAMTG